MGSVEIALEILGVSLNVEYVKLAGVSSKFVSKGPLVGKVDDPPLGKGEWIGDDSGGDLFITPEDGSLISRMAYPADLVRFVNSSVEAFIGTLEKFGTWVIGVEGLMGEGDSVEDVQPHLGELRAAIDVVDPAALSGDENWWSVVVEQIADGMI